MITPTSSYIDIDSVVVPENRIRREFDEDALKDLAQSIWRLGQLQPIVLRDDGVTLIAGERRLRACRLFKDQKIVDEFVEKYGQPHPSLHGPLASSNVIRFVIVSDLTDEQQVEAELEENTHRSDLTWEISLVPATHGFVWH